MVPHYHSSCNLSRAMFLLSKGRYWSMNMHSKSGNVVGTSPRTSRRSIQQTALPPIKAMLYWHACMVSLPVYGIQTAIKYHLRADSWHAFAYVITPVNSFGSASFKDCYACSLKFLFWSLGWSWGILLLFCRCCWHLTLHYGSVLHPHSSGCHLCNQNE